MKFIETWKIAFINVGLLVFIDVVHLQAIVSIILMLVTGGYTLWKWITERREKKKRY